MKIWMKVKNMGKKVRENNHKGSLFHPSGRDESQRWMDGWVHATFEDLDEG